MEEEHLIKERVNKLNEIKSWGINPYLQNFEVKDYSGKIKNSFPKNENSTVIIAGRVMTKRDMGKAGFLTIKDVKGTIQCYAKKEVLTESYKLFRKLDLGDIIGVKGTVFKTQMGEITVNIEELTLLTKSVRPIPDKFHGLKDIEERYRKRYLDLISNDESMNVFLTRTKIIDEIRAYLKENEFTEVETPTLQSTYGGASAQPFITHLNALDMDVFLSISPELHLKRLVVGGIHRVFTICKNFRNEDVDTTHNPEFTMLEFYHAFTNYERLMEMTEEMFDRLKKRLNLGEEIEFQGKKISLKTPFPKVKFRDLILDKTGIDINEANDFKKLADAINGKKLKGVNIKDCKHYGALLDEMYKRVVRPNIVQPMFLTHYPVEMIALAKRNEEDSTKINSFQLLIDGAEMLKAYDELNDPFDQKSRLKEQEKMRKKGDDEAMPMDEDFIEALEIGMPPTAGFGMGIDRLVMLLTDQPSVRDVILFPFMKKKEE